ncbi:hypothetical protein GCM10022285_31760 [Streptomyces tunisiensis]|uniref:Uncharacterized protein n=1 Tax=Streptomyces tunisiensis TaxID=948699 RepID=A0ABP7YIG6_9ACTN
MEPRPAGEGANRTGGGIGGRPAAEGGHPAAGASAPAAGTAVRGAERWGRRSRLTGRPLGGTYALRGPPRRCREGRAGPGSRGSRRNEAAGTPQAVRQEVPFSWKASGCAKLPL